MKCPNCEKELEEGKLYCSYCGYEIQIVPDFEPEIENSITQTLSGIKEELEEKDSGWDDDFEKGMEKPDLVGNLFAKLSPYVKILKSKKQYSKVFLISLVLFIMVAVFVSVKLYQSNSYNYQISKAVRLGEKEKYVEAISYLERALQLDNEDPNASLLLADYYEKQSQEQDSLRVLQSIIANDRGTEEIYRKLIELYERKKDFAAVSELLNACKDEKILNSFLDYAALPPEFSVTEGTYYEIVPLKLIGNTSGVIYYTLDGSKPNENSLIYESPIFLESGDYKISAMYINKYGVRSKVVKKEYHIDVTRPYPPEINLYSGTYKLPEMIEIEVPEDCSVHYTTDGSEPTQDSNLYAGPIPMPLGISHFKFIVISEAGVPSDVVERSYELSFHYNLTYQDAVTAMMDKLLELGIILDMQGYVPDMTGRNIYTCNSAFTFGNQAYYLIIEQYEDAQGTLFQSGNQFGVNVLTGELCHAVWDQYGHYNVTPF